MSETPDSPTVRSSTATATREREVEPVVHKTPKAFLAAAWVAIVAGVVFIIAVIFFTGFMLGKTSSHHGGHHGHHKHHAMMWHKHGPGGPGGQFGPGGGGGQPSVAPPAGPGGPSQIPSSVVPSPSR